VHGACLRCRDILTAWRERVPLEPFSSARTMHSVIRLVALLLLGAALALASPTDTIGRFGLRARSGFLRGENAGRMARGLPPTKPRKLFNPSKTGGEFWLLTGSRLLLTCI
jgi:hypothetical protein